PYDAASVFPRHLAMAIGVTEVRKGMILVHEGALHVVVDYEHIAPGNWRAINQLKLKNLKTGNNVQLRLGSSEMVEPAHLEAKPCQYLYFDHNQGFMFMDNESFEQYAIPADLIGDKKNYLVENANVVVTFHEGAAVNIDLPPTVVLKVVQAETAARGNTVNGVTKNVTVETGYVVRVPGFIEAGEAIKISTDTGEFQGRSK
ncbi:MAG TPA: elongation factor P, partial [Planctomycetota bacterium]|nr:elongation factor P [Planctomycetota bacterium]